ncbi:hypothetical protein L0F63_006819, partial [Massospora cicadina]
HFVHFIPMRVLGLFCLAALPTFAIKCFEHPKPLERGFIKEIPCEYDETATRFKLKSSAGTETSKATGPNNMIKTNLSCTLSQDVCDLVSKTFTTAGIYLSNILQFSTPVNVRASFYSFCKVLEDCSQSHVTLGQAAAARSVTLKDSDGQERLYPQSLVKQIKLSPMPRISAFDIVAEFNSDANFWFPSSGGSPKPTQVDFLLVVSHELLHGLGFASTYDDYFFDGAPQSLTPSPVLVQTSSGKVALAGFYENVFDRSIELLGTGMSLSNYTMKFKEFASWQELYKSTDDLVAAFQASPLYSLGQDVLKAATTSGAMGFQLGKQTDTATNGTLILETGLTPFSVGSSISHVAYKTYSNTKEFLMRYEMASGSSLSSLVRSLDSWGSEPYGPAVVAVLEKMGYSTNENPDPNILVTYPDGSGSMPLAILTLLSIALPLLTVFL